MQNGKIVTAVLTVMFLTACGTSAGTFETETEASVQTAQTLQSEQPAQTVQVKRAERSAQTEQTNEFSQTTQTEKTAQSDAEEREPKIVLEPISPLSVSRRQSYFENKDFSVTAELKKLQSSLYYPDIVAQMGADPEMFAVEILLRVKNISYDDKIFDCSKLSLFSGENALYLFDGEKVEVNSAKTEKITVKVLCTLVQAEKISGLSYDGIMFEKGKNFIPESFPKVIEVQSQEDVRTYLYKRYEFIADNKHYMFRASEPVSICAYIMGRFGDNDEYLAVEYAVTNRSDYAMIIDPRNYYICLYGSDFEGEAEMLYIHTLKELMYEPKEMGEINGIGKVYEIPDFICMVPDKCTKFVIVYKAEGHITQWQMGCYLHDEPYYAQYESFLKSDCDY